MREDSSLSTQGMYYFIDRCGDVLFNSSSSHLITDSMSSSVDVEAKVHGPGSKKRSLQEKVSPYQKVKKKKKKKS